jgi:excinuclease ABC subunit A
VDAIFGIPPTVAIEQRVSRGGRKSTVATLTELHHFLRLLYMKLGTQHCPRCAVAIEPQSVDAIAARILREQRDVRVGLLAPLVVNRKGYYTDLARWAHGRGHTHLRVDGAWVPTGAWPRLSRFQEHTIELPVADVRAAPENEAALRDALRRALDHGKGVVHVVAPLEALERAMAKRDPALARLTETVYSVKRACPACGRASRSSIRGSSPTTPGTGGAGPATAPASSSPGSTRSRPARKSGGTTGTRARRRPAPPAAGGA